MFLAWVLFGAMVGALAGTTRGFSPIVGIAAGAFLGILSPLLFVASGLATRRDLASRQCGHGAERIKAETRVCKHCGRQVLGE
jgi:hypothetical protein